MLIPILLFLFSCSTKADESYGWDTSVEKTDKESFIVENFIDGFEIPWGMCFLPNEDLLVSDRNGTLWQVEKDGKSKKKILGVPKVKYKGQGGLLDVQIHPNFVDNNLIYNCFSDFLQDDKVKKSQLEKIILVEVPSEIYGELRKIFVGLFENSGFKDVKISEKIDFLSLYNLRKAQ